MAENTAIPWTDHTWNWAQGCPKNNDSRELACKNCYMYRDKKWHGQDPAKVIRSAKDTFYFPLKSKLIKPGDKIFTCSWADFFHELTDPWRPEAWDIIRRTPKYIYQILTKWPENIMDRLPDDFEKMVNHVWLGFTAETQKLFDKRVDYIFELKGKYPGLIAFWSAEPLLEEIIANRALKWPINKYWNPSQGGDENVYGKYHWEKQRFILAGGWGGLDWVICGGETGSNARPMHPDWARSLRDQCKVSGTPFFFKQWGTWAPAIPTCREHYVKVNKHTLSHLLLLDGKQYHEFPEV